MAARRQIILWAALPLALLLLAGALVRVALSPPDPQRRLLVFPDGSRLTVLGASLAGQPFTTDKPWQATLRRRLPAKLQGWLPGLGTFPAMHASSFTGTNLVWVWFTFADAKGTNSAATSLSPGSRPWYFNAAVSESGSRFGEQTTSASSRMGGMTRVYQLPLFSFPRRQREFELQFFEKNMKLLGSVSVPNPDQQPFPEWKPERLPIIRTNGPLVVTLVGLTEALETTPPFTPQITPKYSLASSDPDWRLARPLSLSRSRWSDATGNMAAPLDYQEKAWKLSVQFRRVDLTTYSEAERFVLSGLNIPEPGTLQVLTNEFERLGMKFKIRCLAGAGSLAVTSDGGLNMSASNGIPPAPLPAAGRGSRSIGFALQEWTAIRSGSDPIYVVNSSKPFFLLEATPPPTSQDEIRFRVVDSAAKELLPPLLVYSGLASPTSLWLSSAKRNYRIQFDATNATGTVSLEVTLNRPRTVEFIINPAEVQRLSAVKPAEIHEASGPAHRAKERGIHAFYVGGKQREIGCDQRAFERLGHEPHGSIAGIYSRCDELASPCDKPAARDLSAGDAASLDDTLAPEADRYFSIVRFDLRLDGLLRASQEFAQSHCWPRFHWRSVSAVHSGLGEQ